MLSDSRKAVVSSSSKINVSSVQPDTDLTLVKEVDTMSVDERSTVVKIPLIVKELANVLKEKYKVSDKNAHVRSYDNDRRLGKRRDNSRRLIM